MNAAIQQTIINKIIAHFKNINQRPCCRTVKIMTEVFGIIEGGEIQKSVRYMMDGRSNSIRFVYDHPRAYAEFYQEFWKQWDNAQ